MNSLLLQCLKFLEYWARRSVPSCESFSLLGVSFRAYCSWGVVSLLTYGLTTKRVEKLAVTHHAGYERKKREQIIAFGSVF